MYRVSVTTLEKFRRYMNDVSVFDTEESLLESIKGLFLGNDKTRVGGAFHKIIEGEYKKEGSLVIADEISFTKLQAKVALDYKKQHKGMVHEIAVSKIYETDYFPIQVSGRVDGAEGVEVHDAKTKFRSVDLIEFIDSIQWKLYLDMMDTQVFWYHLFEVKGFKELGVKPWNIPADVQIIPHDPLKCVWYETMTHDIQSILNDFLSYMHNREIVHLLKPAIVKPELSF